MKMVITRVANASVSIDGNIVSKIDQGFLVLLGLTINDTYELGVKMVDKLLKLRVFSDHEGKLNLSIKDVLGSILLVSQFTLYSNAKKGNRPSFTEALNGDKAVKLYDEISNYLKSQIDAKFGVFAADMQVSSVNDGPVTIILDSNEIF